MFAQKALKVEDEGLNKHLTSGFWEKRIYYETQACAVSVEFEESGSNSVHIELDCDTTRLVVGGDIGQNTGGVMS